MAAKWIDGVNKSQYWCCGGLKALTERRKLAINSLHPSLFGCKPSELRREG